MGARPLSSNGRSNAGMTPIGLEEDAKASLFPGFFLCSRRVLYDVICNKEKATNNTDITSPCDYAQPLCTAIRQTETGTGTTGQR